MELSAQKYESQKNPCDLSILTKSRKKQQTINGRIFQANKEFVLNEGEQITISGCIFQGNTKFDSYRAASLESNQNNFGQCERITISGCIFQGNTTFRSHRAASLESNQTNFCQGERITIKGCIGLHGSFESKKFDMATIVELFDKFLSQIPGKSFFKSRMSNYTNKAKPFVGKITHSLLSKFRK